MILIQENHTITQAKRDWNLFILDMAIFHKAMQATSHK